MCSNPLAPNPDNGSEAGFTESLNTTMVFPNLKTRRGSSKLTGKLVCPNCYMTGQIGWVFCPRCGKKVDASFISAPLPADQSPTAPAVNKAAQSSSEPVSNHRAMNPVQQIPVQQASAPQPQQHQQKVEPAAQPQIRPANSSSEAARNGAQIEPDLSSIGQTEPIPPLCPECGFENEVGSYFCCECGSAIPVNETVAMSAILSPAKARLRLLARGEEPARVYELKGDTLIGRVKGDITFPFDQLMSANHARIEMRGEDFYIIDDGSQNGTFVRIDSEMKLKPGMIIMLGNQLFRFEL